MDLKLFWTMSSGDPLLAYFTESGEIAKILKVSPKDFKVDFGNGWWALLEPWSDEDGKWHFGWTYGPSGPTSTPEPRREQNFLLMKDVQYLRSVHPYQYMIEDFRPPLIARLQAFLTKETEALAHDPSVSSVVGKEYLLQALKKLVQE